MGRQRVVEDEQIPVGERGQVRHEGLGHGGVAALAIPVQEPDSVPEIVLVHTETPFSRRAAPPSRSGGAAQQSPSCVASPSQEESAAEAAALAGPASARESAPYSNVTLPILVPSGRSFTASHSWSVISQYTSMSETSMFSRESSPPRKRGTL